MIIAILGSSVFTKEMVDYMDRLEALGHTVRLHEHYIAQGRGGMKDLVERMHAEHGSVKKEYDYIRYHYDEIAGSDAILILNFDKNGIENYIGGNSLMEIGFAYILRKKIYLLNPIPKMSYTDEIEAMDPIVLDGDLSKIG